MGFYDCSDCTRSFATEAALRSHCNAKNHLPYECQICEKTFVNVRALIDHLQNAAIHKQQYICEECNRTFVDGMALEQHRQHSSVHRNWFNFYEPEDRYESEGYDYDSEESYDIASDNVSVSEETYCRPCDRGFVNNDALNQHRAFNSAHNWCFVCSRDFGSPQALSQHNNSPAHKGRTFQCPFCSNLFKTPSAIAMHVESGCHRVNRHQVTAAVHRLRIVPQISISRRLLGPAQPPNRLTKYSANELAFNGSAYECYLCHDTFKTLDRLNQHLNSPTHDDTEFQCPKCKSEFQLISGLIQHIESGSCGIARFKEVTDHFQTLTTQFSRLLMN